MDDLNVKTGHLNSAAMATAPGPTLKDAGSSPAEALALAFSQFLRKAAAKPDQLLAGTRGQVIPFQFAARADAGNLQFSLREQMAEHRERRGQGATAGGLDAPDGIAAGADQAPAWTPTVPPGRVDIRA